MTETFMMQDWRTTAHILRALKDIGVRLALDDFGTGYSSLSHLKRFPIDALKIDQSFVRHLATDSDDATIVSAVINMGRSLNMGVAAEGIQTRDQLEFLRDRQCPEGQSIHFALVPAAELTELWSGAVGRPLLAVGSASGRAQAGSVTQKTR